MNKAKAKRRWQVIFLVMAWNRKSSFGCDDDVKVKLVSLAEKPILNGFKDCQILFTE
jgi:hypothetical protein